MKPPSSQSRPSLDGARRRRYVPPVTAVRLASVIEECVRRLTASAPAPRALPYLGLESPTGTGTHLLDALGSHGIFRKYELVLDVAGGLGATGRWLAGRLGCTAVVTAADAAEAAAGRALTRRTRQRGQVEHVPADPAALPFRDARFTHAWLVETLPRLRDPHAVLAELFRVIRPGGHVAIQVLVPGRVARAPEVREWRFATADVRRESLLHAGFADVVVRDPDESGEHLARVVAARAQLHEQLAVAGDAGLAAVATERAALAAALASGSLRTVQLFGRRP